MVRVLRIINIPPAQAVSSTQNPPVCSTLRFAIFYTEQPSIIVEKHDRPQASILIVDVVIPYPPSFKPLSIALDMRGHVVIGAEQDMEFLGWVIPCYADYFWCVDHWWCCADDL